MLCVFTLGGGFVLMLRPPMVLVVADATAVVVVIVFPRVAFRFHRAQSAACQSDPYNYLYIRACARCVRACVACKRACLRACACVPMLCVYMFEILCDAAAASAAATARRCGRCCRSHA